MTHSEKIGYFRIAASLCNLAFKPEQLDLLVSLYEAVNEKKGEVKLMDVIAIELEVQNRQDVKTRVELLNKISEKR